VTKRFPAFSTFLKRFKSSFETLCHGLPSFVAEKFCLIKFYLKKASKFSDKTAEDGKNFRPYTPRLIIDLYNRCTHFDKKKRPSFKDVIKFFIELERKKIKFSI